MSAESLRARLARLRREGGAGSASAPATVEANALAPAAEAPPAALARVAADLAGLRTRERLLARPPPASLPEPTLGPPRALQPARRAEGLCEARVECFGGAHAHGAWTLEAGLAVDALALARAAREPALAELALADALFLDTETSGLAGGAGTWVFLVGLGRFRERGFELWQGFLADPARERALLAEVAERVRAAPLVVSFFGKSFDRHRLEDKMRQHGLAPPFAGRAHLDLYHPLRRLYAGAYDDLRLATLERALVGVERVHDLSGAHAPEAWYDFLAGRPHRLERVFAHNRDDVLSLVTLAAHLGCAPSERRPDGAELEASAGLAGAARAAAFARACAEAGEREEGERWLALALARGADAASLAKARAELAKHAERAGEREAALGHCRAALAAPLAAGLRRELERRRARLEARA